jgi:hypothetical protein
MTTANSTDPFEILKLPRDANETEIRARYLDLVKKFPPETDPDKFREVRAAYEAIKDPLAIARRLLIPPGDEIPEWDRVIESQKRNLPRLSTAFLLSLGNRAADDSNAAKIVNNDHDPHPVIPPPHTPASGMSPSDPSSQEVDAR